MGWQTVVLHARGCGGTPNRLPRGYHAGETRDLGVYLDALVARGHERIAAVGYSLGGNVLVKYLGETGQSAPLVAAVAISVPYDLRASAASVDKGFARLYRNRLLDQMKKRLQQGIDSGRLGSRWSAALEARDFRAFDDLFTGPAHGFSGADDYYDRCSAAGFLSSVRKELLLIHALDDPFTALGELPAPETLPAGVRLEASPSGGHVGFVSGGTPWRPRFWLEPRIVRFLSPYLTPRDGP
jgi:predicted alpha/beta-fold hydrolase